jgi:hypothetical protein
MIRKSIAAFLALLIPLFGTLQLGESRLEKQQEIRLIGRVDVCPQLPCMTRILGVDNLLRLTTGAGKFQFVHSAVFGLGRRSLALRSSLAHSWPLLLVPSPQSLCVKLQV